jgi:hypothetical protein
VEAGGFGYREWINTVPASGEDWPERDEFSAYSDRAFAEELRPVRQLGALQPDEIVLICVVRNEALRLPLFFTHYRKLGVTRFMVIDNDSTDDTPALLLAEPTADIFHTSASFRDAQSGIYWLNGLVRALCVGHWTLLADADELLVFDGMDSHGLSGFCTWLDRAGQDRSLVPMIDVYPPGIIGESGLPPDDSLLENCWFDTTGYALQRRPAGWLMTGGPRFRLFGRLTLTNSEWASKYALFRMKPETALVNGHFIWPRDPGPARPFAAFVHLKFLDDFAERSRRNEREGQHHQNSKKYREIVEKLAEQPRQTASYAKSRKYEGPESLIDNQLLLPIPWHATDPAALPDLRTVGNIDRRQWTGAGRPLSMPLHEREEFEDFSRRAFDSHLRPIRSRGRLAPGEIGLICVLRNEAARLPLFFDHYRRLGVSRFFMIDNNSHDGSRDLLLAEPVADIFHAAAPFAEGQDGLYWAHAVARHFGEGNWLLRPDADELFVYDGMEEHDLRDLAAWLERHGMDRVFAPLIDLYPSSAGGRSTQALEQQVRSDSWFDNDGYTLTRWPQGWRLIGGPRHRLFHRQDAQPLMMWKYPFFRMRPDTLVYDDHWLWPHDTVTSGALGALVHLKLLSGVFEPEGSDFNTNRFSTEQLVQKPETVMFYEDSKRYRGPRSLIHNGMLMPIDWDDADLAAFADQHEGQGRL